MPQAMQSVIRRALDKRVIRSGDLPSIDLYMDQVITLIEKGYAANRRTAEEKLLTKTMINNYSKEGLIRPVRGKKYAREHILQMLTVYALKGTLSIGEIKSVLKNLYAQPGFDGQRLSDCYETALDCREAQLPALERLLEDAFSQTADDGQSQDGRFAALLAVAALSEALRCTAQTLFDEFFSSPPPAEPRHAQKKKMPE